MSTVPLAAAAIVAIFACGAGYIIGLAFPLRFEEPEAEPTETIETRARKHL